MLTPLNPPAIELDSAIRVLWICYSLWPWVQQHGESPTVSSVSGPLRSSFETVVSCKPHKAGISGYEASWEPEPCRQSSFGSPLHALFLQINTAYLPTKDPHLSLAPQASDAAAPGHVWLSTS